MDAQLSSVKIKKRRRPGKLCRRCAYIKWPQLTWEDHSLCGRAKTDFRVLESTKKLLKSNCPMCPMWACGESIDRNITSDDRHSGAEIILGCTCHISAHQKGSTDTLKPLPSSIWHAPLVRIQTPFGGTRHEDIWSISKLRDTFGTPAARIIDPNIIDYEAVSKWLECCKSYHTRCCHIVKRQTIPGFKVIDCETLQVIPAPKDNDFTYVALSYVWGGARDPKESYNYFPPTIQDAITVTMEFGHRYLWVDQICINQSDGADKQCQIRAVDYIYSQSHLVIIAAAGDSVHHGLPGVSGPPRTPQRRCTLNTYSEFSELSNPLRELKQSVWAQRAWTYQEGFLAARRLVFTKKEVFYVCGDMVCLETFQRPLGRSASRSGNEWIEGLDEYFFLGDSLTFTKLTDHIFSILANYTSRALSFQTDILNACTGLLNKLFRFHFWGIPFLRDPATGVLYMPLLWTGDEGQHKRRDGFPSWSWTSVTGKVHFPTGASGVNRNYAVHVRLADGSWENVHELTGNSHLSSTTSIGPTLRITGKFQKLYWGPGRIAWIQFSNNARCEGDFFSDTKLSDEGQQGDIKALYMDIHSPHNLSDCVPLQFLVFQKVGRHHRRIGRAVLNFPLIRDEPTPILSSVEETMEII